MTDTDSCEWSNAATLRANMLAMDQERLFILDKHRAFAADTDFTAATARAMFGQVCPDGALTIGLSEWDEINWQEIAAAWNEE